MFGKLIKYKRIKIIYKHNGGMKSLGKKAKSQTKKFQHYGNTTYGVIVTNTELR
jgi:hypothetical protein